MSECDYIPDPRELDYTNILFGASSQLYFQYFIYNLLFSKRSAIKWTLWQAVPIVAIVAGKWIGDYLGIFSQFNSVCYDTNFETLVCDPIFIIRLTMILIQLAYTSVILLFTSRLIPIYQSYIERTESNTTCNIIWIKEVCWLFLSLLIIYTVDALVMNLTTAILYFTVAIYSFSRVVALMLNHYVGNFNLSGDLYSQIGIRWSLKRLWYLPSEKESQHQTLSAEKALFCEVEEWILQTNGYANSDFSFKDIARVFPHLNYNSYDQLLQRFCGCNFQAYIRNIRIEQAIKLMDDKASALQLKQIACDVGFESSSSFSRAFKATKGMTASKWRSSNIARANSKS